MGQLDTNGPTNTIDALKEKFAGIFERNNYIRFSIVALLCIFMAGALFMPFPADPFKIIIVAGLFFCSVAFFGWIYGKSDIPILLLIMGTISFGRDFSLLSIPLKGIPLYVTEILIAFSVAFLLTRGRKLLSEWKSPLPKGLLIPLLVYFHIGFIYTTIGFKGNGSAAFRDIVFCLYAVLMIVTLSLLKHQIRIKKFLHYFFPAVGIILLVSFVFFFIHIPRPKPFGDVIQTPLFLYVAIALFIVLFFVGMNLIRSPFPGRVARNATKTHWILRFLLPLFSVLGFALLIFIFTADSRAVTFRYITFDLKMTNIGLYCGLILIFGLSFFTFLKDGIKWTLFLVIYFAFLFVLMAEVRAAWAGLLVSIIFLGILLRKEVKVVLLMLVLMVVSLWAIDYYGIGVKKNKLDSMTEKVTYEARKGQDTTASANIQWRISIWKQTWKEIKEYPIFGWGYGTQIDYIIWGETMSYKKSKGFDTGIVPPHNHLLGIAYKMGFFGLLLFLFINARIFFYGLHYVKRCNSAFNQRFLIGALAGLIYWHGMAFFFDILESPPTSIFLWILLGAILAVVHIDKNESLKIV